MEDSVFNQIPFDGDRLSKEDEQSLEDVVEILLGKAVGDPRKPTERAKIWRRYVALDRYSQAPYEGAPDITTPLIRQKVDGIRAHIESAIDQSPMFLVDTDDAKIASVAPDMERLMESLIEVTESRFPIMQAIRDAVEVGTGIVKHFMLRDPQGNSVPATRYVPFEDIFVFPSNNVRIRDVNFFERYQESLSTIKKNSKEGIYWSDKLAENKVFEGVSDDEWNELHELWEAWVWFRGDLYEVRYSREWGLLSYRLSDWGKILDRAPYDPVYIEPSQLSFWGDSIPQILEGLQEVNDRAFQYELARAQFAMAPPTVVSPMSDLARQLKEYGGWKPGVVLEGTFDPQNDLFTPFTQLNPFNMQMMQLVGQMAEAASVPDMLIPGRPTSGRKTATEVSITTSSGSQKLKNYLSAVGRSLRKHAQAKWSLIAYYILKVPDAASSTRFTWIVNGRETVPEQQMRLQQIQYLLNPQFLQLIQMSQQDPFLRAVLEAFLSYLDLPGLGAKFRRMMGEQGGIGQAIIGGVSGAASAAPGQSGGYGPAGTGSR